MLSNSRRGQTSPNKVYQFLIGLGFASILFIILGLIKFFQIKSAMAEGAKMGPPPQAVTTQVLKKETWNSIVDTSGRIEPVNGALIKAEANGRISSINFEDGADVAKDQVLIEIEAEVQKAEYAAASSKALLAKKSFQRQEELFKVKAISQEEFDTARLNFLALEAGANSLKATVDHRILRAPFSGKIGVRRVTVGQYVMEGDPLFQLQDNSKSYITFSLGQDDSFKVEVGNAVTFTPSNNKTVYNGKISAIDPNISNDTGTKNVKAVFDSQPANLVVGTYGRVQVTLNNTQQAFVIPATSIQHAPYGDSVFVVDEKSNDKGEKSYTSEPKFVKVSDYRGDFVAILDGLPEGQQVVTSGTFKLQKGTNLIINNSLPPASQSSPDPKNS